MRHTLLCVDDRPIFLQLRKATLESLGYSVAIASSTGAAIALLQETAVSAVLMDYKGEGTLNE